MTAEQLGNQTAFPVGPGQQALTKREWFIGTIVGAMASGAAFNDTPMWNMVNDADTLTDVILNKLTESGPHVNLHDFAGSLYTAYSEAVGGVNFQGDRLPDWPAFAEDPAKEKQVLGWMAAAREALRKSGITAERIV